jgi:hypothetical protein
MLLMSDDDLAIPAFLRRSRDQKPVEVKPRRKRFKARRPEGERYEDAERWEVFIANTDHYLRRLGSGIRRVWVAEDETGSRLIWLHDGGAEQSVSMSDWARISAKGRRLA